MASSGISRRSCIAYMYATCSVTACLSHFFVSFQCACICCTCIAQTAHDFVLPIYYQKSALIPGGPSSANLARSVPSPNCILIERKVAWVYRQMWHGHIVYRSVLLRCSDISLSGFRSSKSLSSQPDPVFRCAVKRREFRLSPGSGLGLQTPEQLLQEGYQIHISMSVQFAYAKGCGFNGFMLDLQGEARKRARIMVCMCC